MLSSRGQNLLVGAELERLFVRPDTSIRSAIATIEETELQIVLVVDDSGRLLGTVTDGDVRRGLLRGLQLEAAASEVMTRDPVVAARGSPASAIEAAMVRTGVRHLPLVDDERRLVGLALALPERRPELADTLVVLMAGGLGTRLQELTRDVPKPLLRVGPKPILETLLEGLVAQGFQRFLIAVNYKGDMIERHFADGSRWGVRIGYLRERDRLGTAGALALIGDRPAEPLLVVNGDILTAFDFRNLLSAHVESSAIATMAVRSYDVHVPFGVIDVVGDRLRRIVEKPVYRYFVNAGIYALSPACLDIVPSGGFFDMTDLFAEVIERGLDAATYPVNEYWQDVGRFDDFRAANDAYASNFPIADAMSAPSPRQEYADESGDGPLDR